MTCMSQRARNETLLVGWAGVEKGRESRCCAVRKFGATLDDVTFSGEISDGEPDNIAPFRPSLPSGKDDLSKGSKEGQKKRKSTGLASRRAPSSASDDSDYKEESSAEQSSEEENKPISKRRKTCHGNTNHHDNHKHDDKNHDKDKRNTIYERDACGFQIGLGLRRCNSRVTLE